MIRPKVNGRMPVPSSAAAVALAGSLFAIAGLDARASEAANQRFAYIVDCGGGYLRIDTEQHKVVSRGTVWDASSTASIRPDSLVRFDGCLVGSVRNDTRRGVVYLVVQKHAFDDAEGNNLHWIAALTLPNFELVSKAGPFDFFPWLLLDAEGNDLLVWQIDEIERYSVPELKELGSTSHSPRRSCVGPRTI